MSHEQLTDNYNRRINYLRLSVTDRCNMRCSYCMPVEGLPLCGHDEILSYEQLYFIAQTAVDLGFEKIRITGGEPLVRKDLIPFLRRLSMLPGLRQLVLTTNGVFLEQYARPLKEVGIQRLNISLDTLKSERFHQITRRDYFHRVWKGIEEADRIGIPLKINMVVMRGVNDDEIEDFAALAVEHPWSVRFIEFMPTESGDEAHGKTVPSQEILERIRNRYRLRETEDSYLSGPARTWELVNGAGSIGVISAISCSFCSNCNRIRITANGMMKTCLFSETETDLKPWLQKPDSTQLKRIFRKAISEKPDEHHLRSDQKNKTGLSMSRVGG